MKLGTQTNSVVNHVMATNAPTTPKVGDGATILGWTDRHAATVVKVSPNGKRVCVREDRAIRTDKNGMSDQQQYRFEPDPNGRCRWFSLRKTGQWVESGSKKGNRLRLGVRDAYHDYSF